ncbi:MAG: DUF3467 domain-containing protein [Anaerolineae bacterium]|nr:DUF3467 domain-containing protein [Anaerolineae bacterium]
MPPAMRKRQIDIEEILNAAIDATDNKFSYATNIRLNITNNEVTLDFYFVGVDPRNPNADPIAQRLNRIVIPVALAKNIGELLIDNTSRWEETFGVELPFRITDSGEAEAESDEAASEHD